MTTRQEMISRQQPMQTKFGYRTTATEILSGHDLAGTTAIVTGGYSGLGLETVKALSGAGANVIVPARRAVAARQALIGLPEVTVAPMDLGDLESVADFTATVRRSHTQINLIINAAGIMASPMSRTPQGWESQFGINHLGHFALVAGLWEELGDHARVISYSSIAHYRSPIRFDDINFEKSPYDPWTAYAQSKTANALFAVALDSRGANRGIHSFSVHPGGIMTDLQRHLPKAELLERRWIDEEGKPNPMFKTPAQGAATGLWAATDEELTKRGGVYCEDCAVKGIVPPEHTDMTTGGVKEWAIDMDSAEHLFAVSVKATGIDPFTR